jgi:hypothetical protein
VDNTFDSKFDCFVYLQEKNLYQKASFQLKEKLSECFCAECLLSATENIHFYFCKWMDFNYLFKLSAKANPKKIPLSK